MKKIISLLLTFQIVASLFIFAQASEEKLFYTELDLTNYYDTIAFLSDKDKLNETYTSPHLFIETNGDKSSTPFAIDKNDFDEKYKNGKLTTEDGTPYTIKSNDNVPGAVKGQQKSFYFPSGHYSQIKILAVRPKSGLGIGDKVEHDYVFTTTHVGNTKATDYSLNSGVMPKSVGTVKYINDEIASDVNTNILEYTINLTESDKNLLINRLAIYFCGKNTFRFLAVTLVKNEECIQKEISEKISAVLSQDSISSKDFLEVREYIEKEKAKGVSTNGIEGMSEFETLEKANYSKKYYKTVDLTNYYDTIAFLSDKEKLNGTYTSPDLFIETNNGNSSTPFAIDKTNFDEKYPDGKLTTDDGTPYIIKSNDNVPGAVRGHGKTFKFSADYYSQIKLLAVRPLQNAGVGAHHDYIYSTTHSGNTKKASYTLNENVIPASVGTVEYVNGNIDSGVNKNLLEYTIDITDNDNKILLDSISFWNGGNNGNGGKNTTRFLAVTLVEITNEEIDNILSEFLKEMPSIDSISLNAYNKLAQVKDFYDILCERGVHETLSPGLKLYNQYLAKIDELAKGNEAVINVSTNGDDESLTSTPLKTLSGAQKTARNLKDRYPDKTIRVVFSEGTYRFLETVKFDSTDSGTEDAPVIYEGEKGKKVYFKGSATLDFSAFTPVSDENVKSRLKEDVKDSVYELDLTEFGINELPKFSANTFGEANSEYVGLYLDNKEQQISQFPNGNGEYSVWEEVLNPGGSGLSSTDGAVIKVSDSEIENWKSTDDCWVGGYFSNDFRYQRVDVKSIDSQNKTITFATGTDSSVSNEESKRWKIFNILEEIDSPGEWYIDRDTLKLYYYKPDGVTNGDLEISLFENPFITTKDTDNIIIRNIEFSQNRGAGIIVGEDSDNVMITNCTFSNIAKSGIRTSGSIKGTFEEYYNYLNAPSKLKISDCDFYNIGSCAVFTLGGGNRQTLISGENVIYNNYIYKASQYAKNQPAIMIQGGMNVTVENNVIHNTPFHAINFFGNDHKIRYNEIENACNEATDASVIYTGRSYVMRGNEVSYNLIHDYRVHDEKIPLKQTSAVYLDDMASGTALHHNIIVNGTIGLHISGGQDNDVDNNIILKTDRAFYTGNPGDDPVKLGDLPDVAKTVLETYPIWKEKYPDIQKSVDAAGPPYRNVIQYNLSDITPNIMQRFIDLGTVSDNLVSTEDIYNDSKNLDYTIKSGSSVLSSLPNALSTSNFDIENIGLQLTENRTSLNINSGEFTKYYPQNNSKNLNPYDLKFFWSESEGADSYKLVIATDENMKNVVYEKEVYDNFCNVKNLDTDYGKYYYQVYALNKLRQKTDSVVATDGVYSFETNGESWVYESDSKPCITVDMSGKNNSKTLVGEGETNVSVSDDTFCINRTKLENIEKESRNVLNVDGVTYKIADKSSQNDALKSGAIFSKEVTLENEYCESISFLATATELIEDYEVKVYYTDNKYESVKVDVGAYNSFSYPDSHRLVPAFILGTVDCSTGKVTETGGYLYKFDIPTDSDKKVSKIVFPAKLSNSVYVYAVTQVLPEEKTLSDGTIQYNIPLNSENKNTATVFCALYDGEDNFIAVGNQQFELGGKKENLLRIQTPKTQKSYSKTKIFMWSGNDNVTPYSQTIIKEAE